MIYNVLDAAAQLTEEIISGTRAYIMQKHNSALEVDEQHRRLVEAIISGDRNQAEKLMREHMETIEKYILEIAQQAGGEQPCISSLIHLEKINKISVKIPLIW